VRGTWITTALAASAVVLAGCGSGSSGSSAAAGPTGSGGAAAAGAASGSAVALKTWSSPLGEVVVTPGGSAVYVFDKDTPGSGTSASSGTCANLWPAVTTTSATPQVSGVTGTVGTIPRDGGTRQLTLDGHPLYTYAGDSPGQVSGEGVQGIWWVVSPAGQAVHPGATAPSSSASSSSSDPGYTY
jgi:predicted lipoprotein with Yx(FWY)xxD motif